MKRNFYVKRYKNKDGEYTVKIYGLRINGFGRLNWGYIGRISKSFNDEPAYHFKLGFSLTHINEYLIEVINKEIQLIRYKLSGRLK